MSNVLVADLTNKKLRRELGGSEFSLPVQTQKGFISYGLRFSKQQGARHVAFYPKVREIRVMVGRVDLRPEWGEYTLKIGTTETPAIPWDADAAAVQAAIDSVGYTSNVEEDNGTFVVYDVPDTIAVGTENCLRPMTFIRVHHYMHGTKPAQAIRLQQTPLAYTDQSRAIVPDAPWMEEVAQGSTFGDSEYPAIQKLNVPLDFEGTYILRSNSGAQKSGILGVADGPEEIAEAINPNDDGVGLAPDNQGEFIVTEDKGEPAALIEFAGSMLGVPQSLLEVDVVDAPDADHWFDLRLDTVAMAQYFRETDKNAIRAPFEIYADFEDEDDPSTVRSYLVYRDDITINEAVDHEDLSTAQQIDFLRPPAAANYQPVDPSQIATGTRFYDFAVPVGGSSTQVVTHNLASPRTDVVLRENTNNGALLVHGTDYTVELDSDDQLTVELLGAYASTAIDLLGTVEDNTLTSTWLGHTHNISDINGLQTLLDSIAATLSMLQAMMAIGGIRKSDSNDYREDWLLPKFFEVFPILGRSDYTIPETYKATDLDQAQLPSLVPPLHPAVHAAASTAIALPTKSASGGLAVGDIPSGNRGDLFENQSGQDVIIGLVSKLETEQDQFGYSYTLRPGEMATHNGTEWYPLGQYDASEDSYYSKTLERTLFQDSISASHLAPGREYEVRFSVDVAAIRANTPWHWHVVIELAQLTQEPGGSNLENDLWGDPVLDERIVLMSTPRNYTFGYRVVRDSQGAMQAERLAFGAWQGADEPVAAEFGIRARLVRADTVNRVAEPRGFLVVGGLELEEGESGRASVID